MAKLFSGTDEEWDALILTHENSGSVLQSSLWSRVQEARHVPHARVLDDHGHPSFWVALPIKSWLWVWYSPKGPAILPQGTEWVGISEVLQGIKKAGLLRIEPHSVPAGFKPHTFSMRRRRDISPTDSLITAIAVDDELLLKSFHEKTRYNIRVALKHGVEARKLTPVEISLYRDKILELYHGTSGRHAIAATPHEDLEALFSVGDVWAAFHETKLIATSINIGFGSIMTYLHGASSYEDRALMAPYALHWAAMRDARNQGYTRYDWWGVAPEDKPDHKLAGVTRFKLGFGGERVSAPGTFDIGIDRVRYTLYTLAARLRRP